MLADDFVIDDPDLPTYPETPEQAHARINAALEVKSLQYKNAVQHGGVHDVICCRTLAIDIRGRTS